MPVGNLTTLEQQDQESLLRRGRLHLLQLCGRTQITEYRRVAYKFPTFAKRTHLYDPTKAGAVAVVAVARKRNSHERSPFTPADEDLAHPESSFQTSLLNTDELITNYQPRTPVKAGSKPVNFRARSVFLPNELTLPNALATSE